MQQYCIGCGRQRVIALATNDVHSWHGSSAKSYEWCANCGETRSKGGYDLFGSTTSGPFTGQSTNPGPIVWDPVGSINPTKTVNSHLYNK